MSRRSTLAALVAGLALTLASSPLGAAPPSPEDPEFGKYLLDRVDDLHRGDSSHATLTMAVKTEQWERSMTLEAWSLGSEYSLIRILEPKKERGTATLKAKTDLFTYLSKTGRTVKISGASLGGSWMGSHFTNDDLIKDTRLVDDFDHTVKEGPKIDGEATWALILVPKPKAVVVWGEVDVFVRKSDLLPVGQLFYDEDRNPVRKLEFSDYQKIAGRDVPMRIRMTPLDKPDEFTELRYTKLEFGVQLEPEFFSVSQLQAL
ncbi:MAG: outer membrane lipoprotein-sorting protein [Deltaproteobacteria bacterium]|nr:outer membrane lipoprotein-sorting protein [Deltaproteobacteria bacterium]